MEFYEEEKEDRFKDIDFSFLNFGTEVEEEKEEEGVTIPYLRLFPFDFDGLLKIESSCPLEDVGDPNVYLAPVIPFNGKNISSLSVRIAYEDPNFIVQNGLSNITVVA